MERTEQPSPHDEQPDKGGNFLCPWCGERFSMRADLNAHWIFSPACNRNRRANNPTQEKYMVFDNELVTGQEDEPSVE